MLNYRYFINKFPKLELFYDKIIHRKIHTDLYLLIPQGNKVFLWFTYYNNTNLCVILHINKYNKITKVEETNLSYDKSLSYGTIISGTYFTNNNIRYITCENVYFYKGKKIMEESYNNQLEILKTIFDNEVRQVLYTNKFTILGLPIICDNYELAIDSIKQIPYRVKGILFQNYKQNKGSGLILNKEEKLIECVFRVSPDIKQDIYELYCKGINDNEEFYNIALIPDYKTSVMMNKMFRKIKENKNLDLLEESDLDDEFENIDEDKFVNLKKTVYMNCIYVKKFRKWKPVEFTTYGDKVIIKREVQLLEQL